MDSIVVVRTVLGTVAGISVLALQVACGSARTTAAGWRQPQPPADASAAEAGRWAPESAAEGPLQDACSTQRMEIALRLTLEEDYRRALEIYCRCFTEANAEYPAPLVGLSKVYPPARSVLSRMRDAAERRVRAALSGRCPKERCSLGEDARRAARLNAALDEPERSAWLAELARAQDDARLAWLVEVPVFEALFGNGDFNVIARNDDMVLDLLEVDAMRGGMLGFAVRLFDWDEATSFGARGFEAMLRAGNTRGAEVVMRAALAADSSRSRFGELIVAAARAGASFWVGRLCKRWAESLTSEERLALEPPDEACMKEGARAAVPE